MSGSVRFVVTYPHPPERVWAALTEREALEAWLMPNDFEPIVGHQFNFRTSPAPGFDGVVHCEVLQVEPLRRLSYSWRGGPLDTTVTFTLEPVPDGTRLTFEQVGFAGVTARTVGWMLGQGWRRMSRESLPQVLDRISAGLSPKSDTEPVEDGGPTKRMRASMWLTSRVIQVFGRKPGVRKPSPNDRSK